jgi:hypothetical protein
MTKNNPFENHGVLQQPVSRRREQSLPVAVVVCRWGAAKEKSSSGFGLALDKRFDELSYFILLVAWKLTGFLENLSQLACRTLPAWFANVSPNQEVSRYAEDVGERGQLFGPQGYRLSFPVRNHALARSQFLGELKLCQARALTCAGQPFPESCSGLLRWSSCCHALSISRLQKIIRNRLHKYTQYVYFVRMSKHSTSPLTASREKQPRRSRPQSKGGRLDVARVDAMHDHCYRLDMMAELLQACGSPLEPGVMERVGIWISQEVQTLKGLLDAALKK